MDLLMQILLDIFMDLLMHILLHIFMDLLMHFLLHLLLASFGGHISGKANRSSDQNRQCGDESVVQAGVKAENDTSFCGD